ncbi:MAG: hypothetical protein ACLQU3_31020 [Limisphaerales bacterium]
MRNNRWFKSSMVEGRFWVVKHLAVYQFQQPEFWGGLLQFLDDLRVLVGGDAVPGVGKFIGDLPLFEMMQKRGHLQHQPVPKAGIKFR